MRRLGTYFRALPKISIKGPRNGFGERWYFWNMDSRIESYTNYSFEFLELVRFPGSLFAYKYVYRFVHRSYNRQSIIWSNTIPQVTNKHSTQ
jgi:hypothetical protein